MSTEQTRSLDVLLALVDAPAGLPYIGRDLDSYYHAGVITAAEAKLLQQHAQRSPRVQKRMPAEARPADDASISAMRAKFADLERRMGWDTRGGGKGTDS